MLKQRDRGCWNNAIEDAETMQSRMLKQRDWGCWNNAIEDAETTQSRMLKQHDQGCWNNAIEDAETTRSRMLKQHDWGCWNNAIEDAIQELSNASGLLAMHVCLVDLLLLPTQPYYGLHCNSSPMKGFHISLYMWWPFIAELNSIATSRCTSRWYYFK